MVGTSYNWVTERLSLYRLAYGIRVRYGSEHSRQWAETLAEQLRGTDSFHSIATLDSPVEEDLADVDVIVLTSSDTAATSLKPLLHRLRPGGIIAVLFRKFENVASFSGSEDLDDLGEVPVEQDFLLRAYAVRPETSGNAGQLGVILGEPLHNVLLPGEWRFPIERWSLLVGRSGVGKTTLLQLVAGVARASGAKPLPRPDGSIYYLPQDPDALEGVSVLTNIALFAPDVGAARRVASQFGLGGLLDRSVDSKLSGGEYQRVVIAQGFAARPAIFLLDEPFNGLDHVRRWQMMRHLRDVVDAEKAIKTVVCIAHDFQFVEQFFDSVYEIINGRLQCVRSNAVSH